MDSFTMVTSEGRKTKLDLPFYLYHRGDKHTKDDKRQVLPEVSQSVQHERSDDASDVTKSRANGHSQVPTRKNIQAHQEIGTSLWGNGRFKDSLHSFYLTNVG